METKEALQTGEMPREVRLALEDILDYLAPDELEDFESYGSPPSNHIWKKIEAVEEWLTPLSDEDIFERRARRALSQYDIDPVPMSREQVLAALQEHGQASPQEVIEAVLDCKNHEVRLPVTTGAWGNDRLLQQAASPEIRVGSWSFVVDAGDDRHLHYNGGPVVWGPENFGSRDLRQAARELKELAEAVAKAGL